MERRRGGGMKRRSDENAASGVEFGGRTETRPTSVPAIDLNNVRPKHSIAAKQRMARRHPACYNAA